MILFIQNVHNIKTTKQIEKENIILTVESIENFNMFEMKS